MLRLLLDIHIKPRVAAEVRAHRSGCEIVSVRDWHGGYYRTRSDELILSMARPEGLTFVTYDSSSIPDILTAWSHAGRAHAGVILVDHHTIAQNNVGAQVRALIRFWDREQHLDWTNVVRYLDPAPR